MSPHPTLPILLALCATGSDQAEVQKVVEQFNAAIERRDVEAAKALFTEDVLVFEGSMVNRGLAAFVRDHLAPELASLSLKFEKVSYAVHLLGPKWAFVTQEAELSITDEKGKKRLRSSGSTYILTKTQAGWRIRHLNW